ncbi:hypothetical protein F6Y24_18390 [Xanthomonas arboricola pv. pruni]|nr:hypothetical protein F6Y24_18390 [Xanthomonas arboricola pv. pruni]
MRGHEHASKSRESGVGNGESGIGNRESGIGNRARHQSSPALKDGRKALFPFPIPESRFPKKKPAISR